MEIIILITSIISLVILAIILKLNIKNIKIIKQIGEDKNLNQITNKLPENEKVCKEILKKLKNENVNIKLSEDGTQTSLYIVAVNTIFIANIKNTFTRIQTIAHECIHSVQDKRLLWFNYIFSNIYLIYFIIITILGILNKLPQPNIFAIILLMASIMQFFVRSFLETDAMIKAKYVAKDYLMDNLDKIDVNEVDVIVENYDKLNSCGIKFYNYMLLMKNFVKIIVFCMIVVIVDYFNI